MPIHYFLERLPFRNKKIIFSLVLFCVVLLIYYLFFAVPLSFSSPALVKIPEGITLHNAGDILAQNSIIKYPIIFSSIVAFFWGDDSIQAGTYVFNDRSNLFYTAFRLSHGSFGVVPVRVTIPEGLNNKEISKRFSETLPGFNTNVFLSLAENFEGYLFPDTYYILPGMDEKDIVELLHTTFLQKTKELKKRAETKGKSFSDVIVMASLLEKEASTTEDRKQIAGILWKRLGQGVPLQVDAVFTYILGKNGLAITIDDLLVDSPYNTYKYKGLPRGPIANPGLDSIEAAIYYVETPYWYYLSDKLGQLHFSVTFDEHKEKKFEYLK